MTLTRKALKALLTLPQPAQSFLSDTIGRSFCHPSFPSSTRAFFEVTADAISNTPDHSFTFAQVVTLVWRIYAMETFRSDGTLLISWWLRTNVAPAYWL